MANQPGANRNRRGVGQSTPRRHKPGAPAKEHYQPAPLPSLAVGLVLTCNVTEHKPEAQAREHYQSAPLPSLALRACVANFALYKPEAQAREHYQSASLPSLARRAWILENKRSIQHNFNGNEFGCP